jgi:catecholate siderophore receptor
VAHIRSRKHAKSVQPKLSSSSLVALTALAAMAVPLSSQAQQSSASDQMLPEVKVRSTYEVPYKADTVSSPKLTQPLVDTPQTISVIKKEVIQEQGLSSVVEALRNTPGITMQLGENGNTSAGDTIQMRGQSVEGSIFIDGIRDIGAVTRDTFNIDQLEVVKGPAGADIGRAAGAGYINLVTKLPGTQDFSTGSAAWNTANNKRLTADVNQKLSETSALRLNAMAQQGGVFGRDEVENKAYGIAPSLALGLGTPTRIYLYGQFVRQDNLPDGGVPTIGLSGYNNVDTTNNPSLPARTALINGRRVDSENFYGSTDDYEKVNAGMATAKVEHTLGQGLMLRNITRYGKSTMDRVLTGVNAITAVTPSDPSSWIAARTRQRVDRENEIFVNQTNLTAEFVAGGLEHSLSTGLELMHERQDQKTFSSLNSTTAGSGVIGANLYNPDPHVTLPVPPDNGAYANGTTKTAALYAFDTIKLNKSWMLNGGVRFEHYKSETDTVANTTFVRSGLEDSGNLLSWKLGAVYKPAPNGSVYAAFANSYTPPGGANFALSATADNVNNPALDPQRTTNIEFGTKWDLLQKRLALTAAVYRSDNRNEIPVLDPVTNTYSQFGKRRVEGVELGAIGQITSAWQISAGIATMDTEVLKGSTGNNAEGAATRWSPELSATLWSTYKLSPVWTIGGGARYVGEQKRVVDPNAAPSNGLPSIPSYWVADAMLTYQASRNLSLQLNLYNLFDKFYINSLNNGGTRYFPGQERSAMLTANLAF